MGNHPDWHEVKKWLTFLEQQSAARRRYLKVYFVYGNDQQYDKPKRQRELESLGNELRISHLALTYVPSFSDRASEVYRSRISPEVANTFILFRNRGIMDKYVNLQATAANFRLLATRLGQTQGAYLGLPEPAHQ